MQIRQWRLDADLTMVEAAARAGVSQPAWAEWEDPMHAGQRRRPTCAKIALGVGQPLTAVLAAAGYATILPNSQIAQAVAIEEMQVPERHRERFRTAAIQALRAVASAYVTAA
jgi:transcriptional regulator with XRE-family HTH domain